MAYIEEKIRSLAARFKLRRNRRDFSDKDYLEAYAERTDALVDIDPKLAIGGLWEEMGQRQFELLKEHGLQPSSTVLDIGCGTLRAGHILIDYLEPRSYFGVDLSARAIEVGKSIVAELGLSGKQPDLRVNVARDLKFEDYQGQSFDYLLAQSVFSHLQEDQIAECFENISSVMNEKSRFFFTFHCGDAYRRRDHTNFEYPMSFFRGLAIANNFALSDLSASFKHPRGQLMLKAELRSP